MAIDIKELTKAVEDTINASIKEVTSRKSMTRLGISLSNDIRKRVRLGYGATENGGTRQRLKPLAESTRLQRQGKIAFRTGKSSRKVYAIGSTTRKDLDSLRGSDAAKKQNARNKQFLKENKPKLHGTTRPTKSNLTQSGLLLRSIGALSTGVGRVVLGFKTRKRAQVAAFVSKQRPFFFATKNEQTRLTKKVRIQLTQLIKRNSSKNFRG